MEQPNSSADALAADIAGVLEGVTALSNVEPDDELELELRLLKNPRMQTVTGIGVQAAWMPPEIAETICKTAERYVDFRKATDGTTTVGTVTISGDGTLVDMTIEETYLKPGLVASNVKP